MTATMNGDDPDAPFPDRLCDGEDDAEHDDRVDASELRDGVEDVRRRRRGVTVSPFRHAVVDPGQMGVRAHQVREHAEQHAATDREEHRERQRKPGRRRRVEPRVSGTARSLGCLPTVSPTLRAVSSVGGAGGRLRDPRVSPRRRIRRQSRRSGRARVGGRTACDGYLALRTRLMAETFPTETGNRVGRAPMVETETQPEIRAFVDCVARVGGRRRLATCPSSTARRGRPGRAVGGRVRRSSSGGRLRRS